MLYVITIVLFTDPWRAPGTHRPAKQKQITGMSLEAKELKLIRPDDSGAVAAGSATGATAPASRASAAGSAAAAATRLAGRSTAGGGGNSVGGGDREEHVAGFGEGLILSAASFQLRQASGGGGRNGAQPERR